MSSVILFKKSYEVENLRKIYFEKIKFRASAGIDRINSRVFERDLSNNLQIINRKVLNGTYKFTRYKEKLISKGKGKHPRVISIPTIRDKIVLRVLCDILLELFSSDIDHKIVQTIISNVKYEINSDKYNYFHKYDIENFYPSIKHEFLFKKIRRRIRYSPLLSLINNAISQSTECHSGHLGSSECCEGVPQGLSISNILASIYLIEPDKRINEMNCEYFRYVDDMLVLCEKSKEKEIDLLITDIFKDLGLNIHIKSEDGKSVSGDYSKNFTYLGYKYQQPILTVRNKSKINLRNSLIKIFTQFKYSKKKNIKLLEWNLNLRMTGCIFNDKKYGWMFFFSQIDDLKLLYQLDHFVSKMFERFNIDITKVRLKRFVRVYSEILNNLQSTNYIPNFSQLTIVEKRDLLNEMFDLKLSLRDEIEINDRFDKIIYRSIKDIEKDFQNFS